MLQKMKLTRKRIHTKSVWMKLDEAPWLAITRRALRPGQGHDLESIRGSIVAGWVADAADAAPAGRQGKRA
jgi:hypothetical protein